MDSGRRDRPGEEVHVWTNRPIWPQGIPRPGKPAADRPAEGPGGGFGNEWNSRRLNAAIATAINGGETPAAEPALGPLPRSGPRGAVPPDLSSVQLARLAGLGHRGAGRHGRAPDRPSLLGAGAEVPASIEATSTPWGWTARISRRATRWRCRPCTTSRRGPQPPVKMTWCDGGLMPGRPDALPESVTLDRGGGVILIGEKGILLHETYGAKPRLYPESLMEEAARAEDPSADPDPGRPQAVGPHRMNWIDAIRGRSKTTCPFEYAGPLTETMLLGVVALRTGQGKRIDYDGERQDHQRPRRPTSTSNVNPVRDGPCNDDPCDRRRRLHRQRDR